MDRFKVDSQYSNIVTDSRLHSNMDRFKAACPVGSTNINFVYIPIWIDLKARIFTVYENLWQCLHSNMDRFKAEPVTRTEQYLASLHSNMDRFKGRCNNTGKSNYHSLHSNMDRFKVSVIDEE